MGSSSDDDSGVQSLLKLKRYEQPPPGYFEGLSHGVIQRLRGPEGLRQQSLLASLGLEFGLKSSLFFGLGAACCLMACYGFVSQWTRGPSAGAALSQTANPVASPVANNSSAESATGLSSADPAQQSEDSSTNLVLSSGTEIYVRPTPVSYHPR